MNLRVDIDHDWTGRALEPDTPCASLELSVDADGLLVSFTAPLHGDALPAAPRATSRASCARLSAHSTTTGPTWFIAGSAPEAGLTCLAVRAILATRVTDTP